MTNRDTFFAASYRKQDKEKEAKKGGSTKGRPQTKSKRKIFATIAFFELLRKIANHYLQINAFTS